MFAGEDLPGLKSGAPVLTIRFYSKGTRFCFGHRFRPEGWVALLSIGQRNMLCFVWHISASGELLFHCPTPYDCNFTKFCDKGITSRVVVVGDARCDNNLC